MTEEQQNLLISWTFVFFHFLAHMSHAATDITDLCVDMCFHFSGVYDYLWTLDYMISVSNPLRNCRTIFHSSYIILHSHQQCMRSLVSTHPHQKVGIVGLVLSCCCLVTELCWTLTTPTRPEYWVRCHFPTSRGSF